MSVLANCTITVLGIDAWRDWMPIVENPGPDGGSPLRIKIRVGLDNSAGDMKKLSFQAALVDDKGKSRALAFRALSDTPWNGELKKGESRSVELAADDGPYLPAGSSVRIRMTWTDQKGATAVLTTPESRILRTD